MRLRTIRWSSGSSNPSLGRRLTLGMLPCRTAWLYGARGAPQLGTARGKKGGDILLYILY
jgi:hypothetical protein